MSHIAMHKFRLLFTISLCVLPKVATSSVDLEDPFLLPFGPKHGDAFASREGCSLAIDLEETFKIGNTAVSKAYVCLDGVIKFTLPLELFTQNPPHTTNLRNFYNFLEMNGTIVAPFFAPHRLENRFLDYRCFYSVEENSFYGNQFWCRELYDEYFKPVGTVYQYDDHGLNLYENMIAEKQLEWMKELHNRKLKENDLKTLIHFDDKLALNYFGQNSTKYVNLAENIFTRQLQSDEHPEELEILTKVVRMKEGNEEFKADWALVVTWYKIIFYCDSTDNFNGYNYECTSSFQMQIVCNEKSDDVSASSDQNKCFVIFNYFEITGWPSSKSRYAKQLCGFFTSLYQTPAQCLQTNFSIETLVHKSNIGVKGLWLYEISNQGDVIFPEEYNVISNDNNFTVYDLNPFEHDEPFLLKFGPISGDKYISRGKTCSMPEVLQRRISLGQISTDFVLICETGYISMTHKEESYRSLWDGDYSSEAAFIGPLVLYQDSRARYEQSDFFDYSCLYSVDLFSPTSYFDDACSKIVSRETPSSSLALLPTYGIDDPELLKDIVEWNRKSLKTNFSEVDIKYDDELSRLVLGEDTTKYVNLAGNVFKRETENEADLAIINSFINRAFPSFKAISAYVVTWYKIGTIEHTDRFNSFQCIIACGENESFIIEDFYELQWGDSNSKHYIEIQGATASAESSPENLTSVSNFLAPHKWVYQLFRNLKEMITTFSFSSLPENQNATDEPFLLPFGPKHGDTFSFQHSNNDWLTDTTYGRGCSFPQILNNRIQVFETTFDWLFVCLNGRIELRSFEETAKWKENGYKTQSLEDSASFKISVFETDLDSTTAEDHLMDYLCVFSQTGEDSDLDFQYLADPCPREKRPWEKWNWDNFFNMDDWPTSKGDLNSVIDWNIERNTGPFDFRSDDEVTKRIFGVNSTKYVNLGNNMFWRESYDSADLLKIQEFVRTNPNMSDFEVTWSYVITWYKISVGENYQQSDTLSFLNSFQLTLACGRDHGSVSNQICFVIFDYFELQFPLFAEDPGVYMKTNPDYVIPVEWRNLTSSSNYGFPGRWVFDVTNGTKPLGSDDFTITHSDIIRDGSEEPFLLTFGPKHGDEFTWKSAQRRCQINYVDQFLTDSKALAKMFICTSGYTSFLSYCSPGSFSSCKYPVLAIYPVSYVSTQDNLMDYMCTESYFDHADDVQKMYREFCSIVDSSDELSWDFYNLQKQLNYDYPYYSNSHFGHSEIAYKAVRFAYKEEENEAIRNWNEMVWKEEPEQLDIHSDDELARVLMGEKSTKYVNLANNVFKRQTRNQSDLSPINSLLQTRYPDFESSWALVVTWYKLPPQFSSSNAYNSYQSILTCDGRTNSTTDKNSSCFVIFDYFEIQWREIAKYFFYWTPIPTCGVKESRHNFLELPQSGRENVQNIWAESNFGVPGIWVIELSQSEGTISNARRACSPQISPTLISMFNRTVAFTVEDDLFCINGQLNETDSITFQFEGSQGKSVEVPGKGTSDGKEMAAVLEKHWGQVDDVQVTIKVNRVIQSPVFAITFYHYTDLIEQPNILKMRRNGNEFKVDIPHDAQNTSASSEFQLIFKTQEGEIVDFYNVYVVDAAFTVPNNRSLESFGTVVGFLETPDAVLITNKLRGEFALSCVEWALLEKERSLPNCKDLLRRLYGCPRNIDGQIFGNNSDAWFARQEVNNGFMGWEYDVCCNDQNWSSTRNLSETGFCGNCEFNPGADFCITSIGVRCTDPEFEQKHKVANQCCYSGGDLISNSDLGSGRMQLVESTLGNIEQHFQADLQHFRSCCLENDHTNECDMFQQLRPAIDGPYGSRAIRAATGTGHITTVDNQNYTFIGLNVYRMLTTTLDEPTEMQVSTRVSGNGILFSGLAVKFKNTTLQIFISEIGVFEVVIDKVPVQLHLLKSFSFGNIQVTENVEENSFTFILKENQLIVKVLITDSFLNIFTSVPPTFQGHTKGLLGFYDGDPHNDFLNSDGETIDPKSDLATLHSKFGQTWSVKRGDWLFTHEPFLMEINKEIELHGRTYEAVYDFTFENENLHQTAEQLCRNISQCLMDIALSGKTSMAEAFTVTQSQVEKFALFNEIHDVNGPEQPFSAGPMETANLIINTPKNLRPLRAKNIKIKIIENIRFRQFN